MAPEAGTGRDERTWARCHGAHASGGGRRGPGTLRRPGVQKGHTWGGHVAERRLHHTAATQDSAGQGLHTRVWRPCSHPQETPCGWDSAGEQWAPCGLSTRSLLDPGRALGACKGRRTCTAGQMLTSSGKHAGTSAAGRRPGDQSSEHRLQGPGGARSPEPRGRGGEARIPEPHGREGGTNEDHRPEVASSWGGLGEQMLSARFQRPSNSVIKTSKVVTH